MLRPTRFLLALAGLSATAWALAAEPAAANADATARLKAAMGGAALDAVTRFDYQLDVRDAAGNTVRAGRFALLPAARAVQVDESGGTRVWSEPTLTWRLREGQWETLGEPAAASYRQHVAMHFLPLLRDPRTGIESRGAQRLRLAPVEASAFDVVLDPDGRIAENHFGDTVVAESDYRQVAGVWWPMAFDVRSAEQSRARSGRFTDVVVHTEADAALPAMPSVTPAPRTLAAPGAGVARLVGAGWLSGADNDYNLSQDAAGTRLVFARSQVDFQDAHIWTARRDGAQWQPPQPASFTDPRYSDSDPWLTPDGRTLYFISNRPLQGDAPRKDLDLWRVAVRDDGFGVPEHLAALSSDGQELGPELHDGWLYFNSTRAGAPAPARMAIWRARVQGEGFGVPEPLGAPFNDGVVQGDFTLSPDGATALFWSQRGEVKDPDLFAVHRTADGWSPAVRLPAPINAPGMDFTPSFSAAGALYFASMRKPGGLKDAAHVFNGQANAWVVPAALVAATREPDAARAGTDEASAAR